MSTCHSPARSLSGTWHPATAVSSAILPAGSATHLTQTLRVAHRGLCTRHPLAQRQIRRTYAGRLPLYLALQLPVDVAEHVAADVADDVAAWLRSVPGIGSAGYAHSPRRLSDRFGDMFPSALRIRPAILPLGIRRTVGKPADMHAHQLRLHSGNTPGMSSIHLRLYGGRLPHMMQNVPGIHAAESAVSHRMTVALSTAKNTAVQAVIL